jgi:hypothetical protein
VRLLRPVGDGLEQPCGRVHEQRAGGLRDRGDRHERGAVAGAARYSRSAARHDRQVRTCGRSVARSSALASPSGFNVATALFRSGTEPKLAGKVRPSGDYSGRYVSNAGTVKVTGHVEGRKAP